MSSILNPKQMLTESTKFRILCLMFKHFSLENNSISALANPASAPFNLLMGSVIAHQPDLRTAGDSLNPVLESFVSNQNSRIFCALTDLHEWYTSGMSYGILQLTTKHINSIFKRPPYEVRPYTRELTYAQRLAMIYHVCNPKPWNVLVQAYEALYKSQFDKLWPDKSKFMLDPSCISLVPSDIYKIIHECISTGFSPQSLAPEHNFAITAPGHTLAKGQVRQGKVAKQRSMSTTINSKMSRDAIRLAIGKPRSTSFANSSGCGSKMFLASNMVSEMPLLASNFSKLASELSNSDISAANSTNDAAAASTSSSSNNNTPPYNTSWIGSAGMFQPPANNTNRSATASYISLGLGSMAHQPAPLFDNTLYPSSTYGSIAGMTRALSSQTGGQPASQEHSQFYTSPFDMVNLSQEDFARALNYAAASAAAAVAAASAIPTSMTMPMTMPMPVPMSMSTSSFTIPASSLGAFSDSSANSSTLGSGPLSISSSATYMSKASPNGCNPAFQHSHFVDSAFGRLQE
ncbi:hypothetical protein LPJ66_000290 [Kickxella alabastrina]|uniref:Uncharacterized protein n=1 Tax=Kickxella alabastrina TaxID=61397 RepID=A0ACC1IWL0_9FUNG|nr:hypothetical protein LPJ66_000290 [Kickxella alabastrina]